MITGKTPPSKDENNWGGANPFLTPSDMTNADYRPLTARHLSREAAARHEARMVPKGSVAVACIGSIIGKVALIDRPTLTNQQINTLVPMEGRTDGRFLYYLLQLQGERLKAIASGSATPIINKSSFSAFSVDVPGLEEQRRIASVLGAFDDLIETQRTIAQVAEDLWRTVVSSAISEDADRVPLSSLADFVNGRNFTRDANGEGLPVIRTPEVRTGPTESTVYNDVEADETRIAEPGDILFVWSGSLMASRWAWGRGLINQHVFKVIPGEDTPDWLAMFAVEELMDDFLRVAADKATTMGHIKRSDLNSPVATPPPDTWNRLDRVVRPLWDEALSAREHIADLTRTRDELLPLLMSGKVRVEDVEIPEGAA